MGTNYTVKLMEGYILLGLTDSLDFHDCKNFDEKLEEFPGGHVIVECENIPVIPVYWLRALLKLQLKLKKENKIMKFIHVSSILMNHLKTEGVDSSLKFGRDLRDALTDLGFAGKRTLDTEFINPFLVATVHVLKVQAQTEAKAGPIHLKKTGSSSSGDVSGVIGIVSESFTGSVVISFPEKTFLQVMSSMLGETYTKIDQEIVDGAGELTNMIFGQAKIVLNDKGYGIKTAIPSVVSGKNHTLSALTKGPVVVVPFESNAGNFTVEICISD